MIAGVKIITSKYVPKDTIVLVDEEKLKQSLNPDIGGFLDMAREALLRQDQAQQQALADQRAYHADRQRQMQQQNNQGVFGGIPGGAFGQGTANQQQAIQGLGQALGNAGLGGLGGAIGQFGNANQGIGAIPPGQYKNMFGMDMAAGFAPDVIDWHDDGSIDWWSEEEDEACV